MSEPILDQSEVLIRKEGGMEYVSAGRYSAWLYLTSQRVIVKRLVGKAMAYPLSHLTKVDTIEYHPSTFSLTNFNLLRISFDNGGSVLFGLSSNKSVWIQAIEKAKSSAPELQYSTIPPEFTKSATSPVLLWSALAFILLCALATFILFTALFLLKGNFAF